MREAVQSANAKCAICGRANSTHHFHSTSAVGCKLDGTYFPASFIISVPHALALPVSINLCTGQWDASKRCATWHLPNLLTPRGSPFRCSAVLGNTHDAPVVAAAATSPLDVSFSCEGVTISGIELEVQLGPTSGSIDKLLRKFASGKYLVTPLLMQ